MLGILVAVFSIVGFNIGEIKFISESIEIIQPWTYAGSIGVINLCIIISMYFMFCMLNQIINRKNKNKTSYIFSKKSVTCLSLGLIGLIAICFIWK